MEQIKIPELGEKLNVADYRTSAKNSLKDNMTPDHIPSAAAIKKFLENKLGRALTKEEASKLHGDGTTLLYETSIHQKHSRTYGGRNSSDQIIKDASDLFEAANQDMEAIKGVLIESGVSEKDVNAAFERIHEKNRNLGLY